MHFTASQALMSNSYSTLKNVIIRGVPSVGAEDVYATLLFFTWKREKKTSAFALKD